MLLSTLFVAATCARAQTDNCLFKNPLCFYNSDILSYLQVMHKQQQYDRMLPFIYGESLDSLGPKLIVRQLSEASFGYEIKRVGVKLHDRQHWSLTYQRTILGTAETFSIDCALVNDTCKLRLDPTTWNSLFGRWK
jgi:hypothetical protein